MPKRWITLVALGLLALGSQDATAHRLPGFPQVRLLSVEAAPDDPLLRRLTVEVRDPAGRQPVPAAEVTVRALHATLGSSLRVEAVRFAAGRNPGAYQGEIRFPRSGRWDLTVEVISRYVGDAHLELEVAPPSVSEGRVQDKPELQIDLLTLRHLAMEWGHLAGFALLLVATGVGLLDPAGRRRFVLVATWVAFALEGGTGLYKMEYSTPFAGGLQLLNSGHIPRVFFAADYVWTLIAKHVLMVIAMAVTLGLTIYAWRTKPGAGVRLWRVLLGVNGLLALAIGAAAAILGLYHAVVLHFS